MNNNIITYKLMDVFDLGKNEERYAYMIEAGG